jgi:hypothetical protein
MSGTETAGPWAGFGSEGRPVREAANPQVSLESGLPRLKWPMPNDVVDGSMVQVRLRFEGLDHVSSALRPSAAWPPMSAAATTSGWPRARSMPPCLFGLVLEKGLSVAVDRVSGVRFGHVPIRIYPHQGISRRRSGRFLVDWVWKPMHGCAVGNEAVQVSLTNGSQTPLGKPVQPIQCMIDTAQHTNMSA